MNLDTEEPKEPCSLDGPIDGSRCSLDGPIDGSHRVWDEPIDGSDGVLGGPASGSEGQGSGECAFTKGVRDENEGDELYEPSIAEGPQNTDGSPPEMDPKKLEEHIHEIAEPWKVKHVTMVEPVESRSTAHVIPALDKIMTRMRYLGITVRRLHSDRAKELLARKLEAWVAHQNLFQTFTCADDPAANGHCESEVLQLKRRTRLLLKSQGQPSTSWPAAVRHATEERMRSQLSDLGTPVPGMITYNKHVLVKRKRWHDKYNVFAPCFVDAYILCPSPHHDTRLGFADGFKPSGSC